MYRIHGGTIVCWGAAAVGAAGCGAGACVDVDRVFGGGVSRVVVCCGGAWGVVLGFAVPGRVRDMRGRVGWGGGARVWACVFALCSPRGPFLCLSLTPLFSLACLALSFFFLWGGLAGVLCVGVGVCRCWLPVPRAPVRGGLTAGGWRQWWRGACLGGCGSWLVSGWRGRA